jgi:hypothetical protein
LFFIPVFSHVKRVTGHCRKKAAEIQALAARFTFDTLAAPRQSGKNQQTGSAGKEA